MAQAPSIDAKEVFAMVGQREYIIQKMQAQINLLEAQLKVAKDDAGKCK